MFCERQCALIHIERAWEENRFTAEGRILHEQVDEGGGRSSGSVRVVYDLPLRSLCLGLYGKADVVEIYEDKSSLAQRCGLKPVEYKRGRPKAGDWDVVQLCAQAMCLEEMLDCPVPSGAIFYGRPRRRLNVVFDETLRGKTQDAAIRLHELVASGRTPPARYEKKCESCSLLHICMPKAAGRGKDVRCYLARMLG